MLLYSHEIFRLGLLVFILVTTYHCLTNAAELDGTLLYSQKLCPTCHGPGGVPKSNRYPILAGQNKDVLLVKFKNIQSGKRHSKKALKMSANRVVKTLNDAEIIAIADYLSKIDRNPVILNR